MDTSLPLQHIALVSEAKELSPAELASVSAALQKQVLRDLAPAWAIQATVDVFTSLDNVPLDYWPMIVRDDIDVPGAAGIHEDQDGHPFALIQYSDGWSLTASHECLEMLCDPSGNRVIAGQSPKPGQDRVEFLVEVCDPSEAEAYSYTINGVSVSDFYTPHYFDPVATPGARISFTGAIEKPRDVLSGGYLSWHDPASDHWFQKTFFSDGERFRDLGVLTQGRESIRDQIYRATPQVFQARRRTAAALSRQRATTAGASLAGGAKVTALRQRISELINRHQP